MPEGRFVPPQSGHQLPDPTPLLDTLPERAFLLDADLRVVYVNPALRASEPAATAGHHLHEVFPNSRESRLAAIAPGVLATGRPEEYESRTPNTNQYLRTSVSRYGTLLLVRYSDITTEVLERHRAEGLHQLTSRLATTVEPARAARLILEMILPLVGAYRAGVFTYSSDLRALELVDEIGYTQEERAHYVRMKRDGSMPTPSAVAAGQPVYLQSHELLRAFGGTLPPAPRTGAMAALPLCDDERTFGVLVLSFDQPQPFEEPERRFMESIAA